MQLSNTAPSTAASNSQAMPRPDALHDEPRSSCLLIKMDRLQLIVPRIMVAEVVDLEGITFTSSLNKDIKMFEWRDFQVPLVSANVLSPGTTAQIQKHSKIIVFQAVLNQARLPYYALLASTNPRLVVISASSIQERGDDEKLSLNYSDILMPVMLEGEQAAIPRVELIERFIYDSMPGRA